MSQSVTAAHAAYELGRLGEDSGVSLAIVASIEAFMEYGHSGGSAAVAIDHWERLVRRETLTPLTSGPDEWEDRSGMSSSPLWQNKRDPRAMSNDAGQTWWFVSPRHAGERSARGGVMVQCSCCEGSGLVEILAEDRPRGPEGDA